MRTHNIPFSDKIRKFPEIFVLCSFGKNFVGTRKQARISNGKQVFALRKHTFSNILEILQPRKENFQIKKI